MRRVSKFWVVMMLVAIFALLFFLTTKALGEEVGFEPALNPERDYLVIVNDENPYEFGGEYDRLLQGDLVETIGVGYDEDVGDYVEVPMLLERAASEAFWRLQDDLRELYGMEIALFSGYRNAEQQQEVYDYYGSIDWWAATNKISLPGFSEHHTGLLLNVVIKYNEDSMDRNDWIWYTETAERQGRLMYFKLLHWALADYGFIDRYPAGKEYVTGYPSEPYEIRFVGSAEVAHKIMDNGLTLEEYVAQYR